MTLPRQVLGVVLALLVANPACCCTLGRILGEADEAVPAAAVRPCCALPAQKASEPPAPERPEDSSRCSCRKDRTAVVEAKLSPPDWAVQSVELLAPPAARIFFLPGAGTIRAAWALDPPPPRHTCRVLCRFLL